MIDRANYVTALFEIILSQRPSSAITLSPPSCWFPLLDASKRTLFSVAIQHAQEYIVRALHGDKERGTVWHW
jgi:hypothetical protein